MWIIGQMFGRGGLRFSPFGNLRTLGASNLLSEPPAGTSGFRWSSLALGGVVATVLIAASVVTVLSLTGGDKLSMLLSAATVHPHESTAEWVGDDAAVYASLNLRPGLSKLLRARDFFENIVDFEQADSDFNEGLDTLSDMLGIDVRDGVLPVLGPELAAAVYVGGDVPPGNAEAIYFVGFMDMDVGRSIVDAYITRSEQDRKRARVITVGGLDATVVNDEVYIVVHDTEPYILIGTTQRVLERTLAMMAAPVSPLSESPQFISAMDQLPDDRFISGYADVRALTGSDAIESNVGRTASPLGLSPYGTMSLGGGIFGGLTGTQVFAGAVTVGKKDLRIDYAVKSDPEANAGLTVPSDSFNLIPGELIGFFNMGGLRTGIDQFLKMMEEQGELADAESAFTEQTGLDLRTDLLDPIGDELAVVLMGLEGEGASGGSLFDPVPKMAAAILVEVRDRGRMDATMDRVRQIAAQSGIEFRAVDVGGEQAWVAQMPDESFPLELAYMFKDGFFVGGISADSLEQVRLTAEGNVQSVKRNDAYKRVLSVVGDDAVMTLFVEAEPLSHAVRSFIGPDALPEFDRRYMPWFQKINAFAFTVEVDGEWASSTMLLTIN